MRIIDKYSLDELKVIAKRCFSYRQFARELGYSSDSTDAVKEVIEKYKIDISHFKGQGWNKDNIDYSIFKYGKASKSEVLLRALTILRGWKCEKCQREEWQEERIPLCIHHMDGNHINNEIDNLQVLCPNCHAQTDNYCGKNKANRPPITEEQFVEALKTTPSIRQALQKLGINYAAKYYYDKAYYLMDKYDFSQKKLKPVKEIKQKQSKAKNKCIDCGKEIDDRATRCEECSHLNARKVDRPSRDELKKLIRDNSFLGLAKQFNVSDNAIRKWCKTYNLPSKKSDIKKYTEEEWNNL